MPDAGDGSGPMRALRFALALSIVLGGLLHQRDAAAQTSDAPADEIAADSMADPAVCQARLEARHVTFAFAPSVVEGECAIPLPVKLQSVAVGDETVTFSANPLLDCRLAERLADWVGNV